MCVVVDIGFEMQAYTIAEDGGSVEVCVIMLGATERSINFTVEAQSSSASNLYTLKHNISTQGGSFLPMHGGSCRIYKFFMSHSLISLFCSYQFVKWFFIAIGNLDFVNFTSVAEFSIPGSPLNRTVNQRLCKSFNVLDDSLFEGTERLNISLIANNTSVRTVNASATITILDNDGKLTTVPDIRYVVEHSGTFPCRSKVHNDILIILLLNLFLHSYICKEN